MTGEGLGELRGLRKRTGALWPIFRALRFSVPQGDPLVVLARKGEEPIELLQERRIVWIDLERACDVTDRVLETSEPLLDGR